jgi:hypothetical protein
MRRYLIKKFPKKLSEAIVATCECRSVVRLIIVQDYFFTREYMHPETLSLLTKPLYFPNIKYLK